MNKKGFTLVELITTFALSAVIVTILINVVLVIKNTYSDVNLKTNLLINQGNLSMALNSKITDDNLLSYSDCSANYFCYNFNFTDGTSEILEIKDNTVKFGKFTYKLDRGSEISNPIIYKENIDINIQSVNNSLLVIKIPITNRLFKDKDFGVTIVYQYNSNKISL